MIKVFKGSLLSFILFPFKELRKSPNPYNFYRLWKEDSLIYWPFHILFPLIIIFSTTFIKSADNYYYRDYKSLWRNSEIDNRTNNELTDRETSQKRPHNLHNITKNDYSRLTVAKIIWPDDSTLNNIVADKRTTAVGWIFFGDLWSWVRLLPVTK